MSAFRKDGQKEKDAQPMRSVGQKASEPQPPVIMGARGGPPKEAINKPSAPYSNGVSSVASPRAQVPTTPPTTKSTMRYELIVYIK